MRRATLPMRICRCAAPALLTLASVPVFAQSLGLAAVSIRADNPPRAVLAPSWTVSIGGRWPTQCPPTLQNAALDGMNLRIDARSVLGLCDRRPTSFAIELNPTLALQRGPLAAGVYRIRFYAADGAQAQLQLHAFALIDRSAPGTPAIVPETGFWWSRSGNDASGADRTVLSIELQGRQLSAALLSYDAAGQPAWYFGSAPYDGRIAQLPMLRLSGGSGPFAAAPAVPQADDAMTLDLQFADAAHASAWLSRPHSDGGALQLQQLDLARLPLTEQTDGSAWQGDWVLVSDAAGAVPLRLHLDRFVSLDAQHFQLADTDAATTITCESDSAQRPQWPPHACVVRLAAGAVFNLDSIAIARMDGTDASGVAVHLLRVTP
ncbi:MAG: hypothetical protein ACREPN_05940 [Rudaea sp.]